MFGRQKIAALGAEFVGTAVLSSAILAMAGRTSFPFFAAIIAGLTLTLMVLVFGSVSGAHINPVVTIGLWTIRKVKTTQAIVFVAAQILGGIAAWQLNEFLLDQPLRNIASGGLDWRIMTAEAVGAFVFGLVVAAAYMRGYDATKLAMTSGLGLTLGMVVASIAANGLVNPAVAIGLQSWDWSYVIGPAAGSIIGMNFYGLAFEERAKVIVRKTATTPVKKTSSKITSTPRKTKAAKTTKRRKK